MAEPAWEEIKQEAEALKALAESRVAIARAEDNARITYLKAETEADKARLDYAKAALPAAPDPSKYKPAAPSAPNLAASAARMTFAEAGKLAKAVADELEGKLTGSKRIILPEDARTRTLVGLSRALRKALEQASDRLSADLQYLQPPPPGVQNLQQKTFATAAVAGPALSAAGEIVLALASLLRGQYAFASQSQTTLADGVFRSELYEALTKKHFEVIEPDAIVVTAPDDTLPELKALAAVLQSTNDLRDAMTKVSSEIERLRKAADSEKDEEARRRYLANADLLDLKVKRAAATVDEVTRLLAGFNAPDPQGNTPLESAVRGGVLYERLGGGSAYFLSVKALASDTDTIARQGFWTLHIALSSHTVVQWRATSTDGIIVASGAMRAETKFQKLSLSSCELPEWKVTAAETSRPGT